MEAPAQPKPSGQADYADIPTVSLEYISESGDNANKPQDHGSPDLLPPAPAKPQVQFEEHEMPEPPSHFQAEVHQNSAKSALIGPSNTQSQTMQMYTMPQQQATNQSAATGSAYSHLFEPPSNAIGNIVNEAYTNNQTCTQTFWDVTKGVFTNFEGTVMKFTQPMSRDLNHFNQEMHKYYNAFLANALGCRNTTGYE